MSTSPESTRNEGTSGGGSKGQSGNQGQRQGQGQEHRGQGGGRMEGVGGGSAGELREGIGRVGQQAKDVAYEQLEHLRDRGMETMEQLRERGMEKARQLEDRIIDEPLKSVALAAGVGFVLGLMWMRR